MVKSSNTICIICARGGSKGLSRKNLKLLDGESLIARAIRHAREADCIDTLLVSTDDDEICSVAKQHGAEVPFIRPLDLSGDFATTEETLKHAILTYESIVGIEFSIAVFITVTDIFRDPKWIRLAVEKLRKEPDLESVFSGHRTHKNFWEQQEDGTWIRLRPWMASYSSRQVRRSIVREDTGLACASRAWLWREGRRIGDRVDIICNDDDFTGIDIHNAEDLMLAEAAINIRKKRSNN